MEVNDVVVQCLPLGKRTALRYPQNRYGELDAGLIKFDGVF